MAAEQKLPWELIFKIMSFYKLFPINVIDRWEKDEINRRPYLQGFSEIWTKSEMNLKNENKWKRRALRTMQLVCRTMRAEALKLEFATVKLSIIVFGNDNASVRVDSALRRLRTISQTLQYKPRVKSINVLFVPAPQPGDPSHGKPYETVELSMLVPLFKDAETVIYRQANGHLSKENVLKTLAQHVSFENLIVIQTPPFDQLAFKRLWSQAAILKKLKSTEICGVGARFSDPVEGIVARRRPKLSGRPSFQLDTYIAPTWPPSNEAAEANDELTEWILSGSVKTLNKLCWAWNPLPKRITMPVFPNLVELDLRIAFHEGHVIQSQYWKITASSAGILAWLNKLPNLRWLHVYTRFYRPSQSWTNDFVRGLPRWIQHLDVTDLVLEKGDPERFDQIIAVAERQLKSLTVHCARDYRLITAQFIELTGRACQIPIYVAYEEKKKRNS